MFLAGSLLSNWIFWVVLAAVVVIVAIIIVNVIINSKLKEIEKKDVAAKERNLRIKLGLEDPDAEEENAEDVENASCEETDDKQDELEAEEAKEEVKDEPVEEAQEEQAEKVQEEKAEESVEEVQKEKAEEPVKEEAKPEKKAPAKKQAAPKKVKEEAKEEVKEEPVEEENDAEDLLKDIPDADEMEKELDKKQAEEAKAKEEKAEETPVVAEEKKPEPEKKAPAAKKKAEPKKTATVAAKESAPVKEAAPKQANGKWLLVPESDGYYFGKLFASNGELLLQTERYKGVSGLKSGIETIKKNIDKDNFEITVDKNKTYNFKLFASNNGLLCIGEGYTSRENALSAINSVKNFSTSLTFVSDEPEILEDKEFKIAEKDKNENGKWVIFEEGDGYTYAELRANNGQVLFVTEKYKGINSLRSGLDSIRKNIKNGNFSMRKDKNDNFNFKIFSENKRLLGLGAGYSSATNCESAILSVMKFCDSTVVFNNNDEIDE